jgi:hypothetical protein
MSLTDSEWKHRYCARLRNEAKRAYAYAYLAWLEKGKIGDEPDHPGIGATAARAVRFNLDLST